MFALLELYKRGEAAWEQDEPFGAITVRADVPRAPRRPHDASPPTSRRCCSSRPSRSPSRSSPTRCRPARRRSSRRCDELEADLEGRGLVLRARRRRRSRSPRTRTPRRPRAACSPARARRRSRPPRPRRWRSSPTCSRSRGPRSPASAAWPSESATSALTERGLIEEAGRSQFGAVLYRTTPLFLKLFGLDSPEAAARPRAVGSEPGGGRPRCATACCAPARPAARPPPRARPPRARARAVSTSDAATDAPSTATITPSDTPVGHVHEVLDQHLRADEHEQRAEAEVQVLEPLRGAVEQEVERAQAEQRERVGGEHDERVGGDRQHGGDRVDREHDVGHRDRDQRADQRRRA